MTFNGGFAENERFGAVCQVVNYAGGLHDNIDIKTSISEVITNLYAGMYADGAEAAAAFDALLG